MKTGKGFIRNLNSFDCIQPELSIPEKIRIKRFERMFILKKEDLIKDCYSLFKNKTPLKYDCGLLCGGRCCKGDTETGMIVFPGEKELLNECFAVKQSECGYDISVCKGGCDRNKRPLSCRIYPLFPLALKDNNGNIYIDVIKDPRADCPITKNDMEFSRSFIRAVKLCGEYLLLNEETKTFLLELSAEIDEISELERILKK